MNEHHENPHTPSDLQALRAIYVEFLVENFQCTSRLHTPMQVEGKRENLFSARPLHPPEEHVQRVPSAQKHCAEYNKSNVKTVRQRSTRVRQDFGV